MTGQHAPIPFARGKAQSSPPDYLFVAILVALVALPGLQLILLLQDELW